jgi:hypothetical protein
MNFAEAIIELELEGYSFMVEGSNILYEHKGDRPSADYIRPLLEKIRGNKPEVIEYLKRRNDGVDFASHLFAQAEKAERLGDYDRWVRLGEAAGLERSKSYARNDYDRQRCPNCPHLGQGPLGEIEGTLVLCDTPCPGCDG